MILDAKIKKINVRIANISDADSIFCIEPIAFGPSHWSKTTLLSELNNINSVYFVADVELEHLNSFRDKIIGYTGYWKVLDEGHITTMAVDIDYRRNHIADILLYNLIKSAIHNNIKWLTLEVRSSNIPAINLYSKYRFKHLGIRKNYYQDNLEDAIIMWSENIQNNSYMDFIEGVFSQVVMDFNYADKLRY